MELDNLLILIKLVAAHIVGDFIIQTDKWAINKEELKTKSKYLYLHAIVHGVLAYLFIAAFNQPLLPILITIIHLGIDIGKLYFKKSFTVFALDQLAHLLSIIILWLVFYGGLDNIAQLCTDLIQNKTAWVIITAYVLAIWPTSVFIQHFTLKWQQHINENGDESLPEAGKWIGRLERILILTFIVIGQFEAIGFLLAAKSVFRFGDLKDENDRKRTEYILIGTLLSFTITIGIGLIIKVLV